MLELVRADIQSVFWHRGNQVNDVSRLIGYELLD